MADIRNVNITDACDGAYLAVNTDGTLNVNWDDCPITEDSIRSMSNEEAVKVYEKNRRAFENQQKPKEPIEIMRAKVQSWLKQ
jgi:hypothetical protein